MDVYGKNPVSDAGEYFRNSVWMWRPLWDYCVDLAPDLCAGVSGHFNDGDGLNEDDAAELAKRLLAELESGRTAEYEKAYYAVLSKIPREKCHYCDATGIRTDSVGVEMGMPTRELDAAVAIVVGRTHGTCNACGGEGLKDALETHYPFAVDNVRRFAEFVVESGGFSIC